MVMGKAVGVASALFDIAKLNDVSKDVLVKIPAKELYDFLTGWAKTNSFIIFSCNLRI